MDKNELKELDAEIHIAMLFIEELQKKRIAVTGRRYVIGSHLNKILIPAAGTPESKRRFTGHRTGAERR